MDFYSLSYLLTIISQVYLVVSIYTVFAQTKLHSKSITPRIRLGYWFESLTVNKKIIPVLGYLSILMGLLCYGRKNGNNYHLTGSVLLILTPLLLGIVGKLPIVTGKMIRIHQRYEPNENLTQNQVKIIDELMSKWILFHKIRCVLSVGAHFCFLAGMHYVNQALIV